MARARIVHGLNPKGTVRANARKIVAVRTDEFFAFAPALPDPTNVTELHNMRIAAKRLRYALELFGDALGPDAVSCIEIIKQFQEIVGDIHDHDVHADIVRADLTAIVAARVHALADRAMQAEGAIEPFKAQCRAFITDDDWVAEQTAIAAAIARTMHERRQRHSALVAAWQQWTASGLRARLDALSG
ncbi:MAG: CHAD domain-containing protein [Thermomicrobia bacterium]|nr:CHAD domain-containing protein [Thermomicrobia bacterium]